MAEDEETKPRRVHPGIVSGQRVRRGNITLPESYWRRLGQLAAGNISEGARIVIREHIERNGKGESK